MRFPILNISNPVLADEVLSLDASKSHVTPDEGDIVSILVTPELGGPTIDVVSFEDRKLIYTYLTTGIKTITVEVVTALGSTIKTYAVNVVTAISLKLFSDDSDLSLIESDILGYLPKDKSTFNYVHFRAQQTILTNLDERKIWKPDTTKYVAADVTDMTEVKDWSIYLALSFIFGSLSNQVDDIFSIKSKMYFNKSEERAGRAVIRLQGPTTVAEQVHDLTSLSMRFDLYG